ncbi:MAG: hypothetical protein A3E01_00080 [Gammaproteobacteria bacterium RIFCSPHIGHO2_12_FULL_63_22]|nr:MAG: hypothetical protein A3E01_00080 [Gammaproteobacteria bacterium RIFCSPHIGHO2_12_FULL_63_22]
MQSFEQYAYTLDCLAEEPETDDPESRSRLLRACASGMRDALKIVSATRGLLKFHQEGDDGAELPREYWSHGYREAVERAEALVGPNALAKGPAACGRFRLSDGWPALLEMTDDPTDGDEALMLFAVLLTAGEPRDINSARLAVMRGHGAMGKDATASSGNEWGDTVRWARARGMLIEDSSARTWAAGRIPAFLTPPDEYMKAAATGWSSVTANDFRVEIGQDETERIRQEIDSAVRGCAQDAMASVWQEMRDTLAHLAAKLGDPNARFQATTVSKIEDLVQRLPHLNLTEDPHLEHFRSEIDKCLNGYTAGELREVIAKVLAREQD